MIGRVASALIALSLAALAGCKQGNGERCLVDSDCSSGLTCNTAQQECQPPGAIGGIDATVPAIDAAVVDATAPIDAVDGSIDAPPIDAP